MPDEEWRKMKAAWEACEAAGVAIPGPVLKYFEGDPPDEAGIEVDISKSDKTYCRRYGRRIRS